jgi:hypothetical protein
MQFRSLHRTASRTLRAAAPPETVFPLLCPVREREWVDGWNANVLYSRSGLAELGCVFVVGHADGHTVTYVVTRYEPPRAVAFALFHGTLVETLEIDLESAEEGTAMTWGRAFTGLSPEGNAWIEAHVPTAIEERLALLETMLTRYLSRR